jgi:catechol 2,3-dioxygenase-like lactoylglutathione lyase family enzyme
MKPRIHVITLAVADLDRALAFYRDGLGFQTEGHLWEIIWNPALDLASP